MCEDIDRVRVDTPTIGAPNTFPTVCGDSPRAIGGWTRLVGPSGGNRPQRLISATQDFRIPEKEVFATAAAYEWAMTERLGDKAKGQDVYVLPQPGGHALTGAVEPARLATVVAHAARAMESVPAPNRARSVLDMQRLGAYGFVAIAPHTRAPTIADRRQVGAEARQAMRAIEPNTRTLPGRPADTRRTPEPGG